MPIAITSYQWFLSVHILLAVIWVGGGVTLHLLLHRAHPQADPRQSARLMGEAAFIGNRVFAPSSALLLIMGFILMGKGDWPYHFWVIFGLFGWAFSFLVGVGYMSRNAPPLAQGLAAGELTPELRAKWDQFRLVATVEMVILILVVLDMALKPGA